MYLKAPDEGGETDFPLLGLKLAPRAGDGILFFNVQADGADEPLAEHAGVPVVRGAKAVATKWIHAYDVPIACRLQKGCSRGTTGVPKGHYGGTTGALQGTQGH
jgi:hypothetical protein